MRYLSIRWGTSRAEGYEGQNMVTVRDSVTGKAFRHYGGGYDLERAALSEWLQETFQDKLQTLRERARITYGGKGPAEHSYNESPEALHALGCFPIDKNPKMTIDAGSDEDIYKVAAAIGLTVSPDYSRPSGRRRQYQKRIGWDVTGD